MNDMKNFNPIGAWEQHYIQYTQPFRYGSEVSYRIAAALLDEFDLVEDWGCGCAFAKRFFRHARYLGIDGSLSKWNDVTEDLLARKSKPDGILLRHVLEHNDHWQDLLQNALNCAQRKLVIVFYVPPTMGITLYCEDKDGYPRHHLSVRELLTLIGPRKLEQITTREDTIWDIEIESHP